MAGITTDSSESSEDFLKKFELSQNKVILQDLKKFDIGKDTPHPDLRKNTFYKKSGSATPCPDEANVTFTDMCHSFMSNPLSAVIGPYGSGKTTLLKRVAVFGIQSVNDHYYIYLKFSDMDYKTKISLKELLRFNCPNLSADEFTKAFDVLLHNQEKCLLLLDGFDEAKWWEKMKDKPARLSYDEKAQIWEIIGNLLNKHLLCNTHVVFTSRSIAMLVLPYCFRPSNVYVVNGFTESTVQSRAGPAWLTISKKIPAIKDLCHNPLLLNHVLDFIHESNAINSVTVATVLEATFDRMCTDLNARQDLNEAEKCKLQSLAFAVIHCSHFTEAEIQNQEIAIEKIQDFLEASPETLKQSSKVNAAKVLYRFFNPSIKAYLAARHLSNCDTSVLEQHVATVPDCVRRCLCGILFHKDLQDGQKIEQLAEKRFVFEKRMKTFLNGDADPRTLIKRLTDIREGGEDLLKDLACYFPVAVDCRGIPLTSSDLDALLSMVRIFSSVRAENVIMLNLSHCRLNDSHLLEIQTAMNEMEKQIEELHMSNNHFSQEKIKNFVDNFSSKQCKITAHPQLTETSQVDQNFPVALSRETASPACDTSFQADDSYEDTDKAFFDIPDETKPHAVEPSAEPHQPQGDLEVTLESDRRSTNELPQVDSNEITPFVDGPDQQEMSENSSISLPRPEKPPQVESENPSSGEAATPFVKGQDYSKLSEIYAGMAKVHICRGCSDKKFYAMKHCNCDLYTNMKSELETMKVLSHPNCIQYNTDAHDEQVDRSVIVMELCVATVRQYIKTGEQKCIDTERGEFTSVLDIRKHLPISRLEIVRQSLEGVAYLHSLNYVHRDIKPENFLLTKNSNGCVVKVADFGLTRKQDDNRSSIKSQSLGSPSYMAPENHDGTYEFASDVFSFAIYAFEVFTLGQHPYGKTFQRQQCNIIENEPPNLDYLEAQTDAAVAEEEKLLPVDTLTQDQRICACDMLRRMLHPKRSERMDIWCVKSHPTFWDAKKKVEYFVDVQKTIENLWSHGPEAVARLKLNEYDKSLEQYPTISKETFPAACLRAYRHRVVFYEKKDPLLQLIKAVRDKASHIGSLHPCEDDAVGVTKSSPQISAFSDEEIKRYGISNPSLGQNIEVCWEKFYEAFTCKAPHVLVHVYEKFRSERMVNRKEYYPSP